MNNYYLLTSKEKLNVNNRNKVMLYGLFLFTIPFNGSTKKKLCANFCENQSTITDTTTIVAATVLTDICEFIHPQK